MTIHIHVPVHCHCFGVILSHPVIVLIIYTQTTGKTYPLLFCEWLWQEMAVLIQKMDCFCLFSFGIITHQDVIENISTQIKWLKCWPLTWVWEPVLSLFINHQYRMCAIVWNKDITMHWWFLWRSVGYYTVSLLCCLSVFLSLSYWTWWIDSLLL